MARKLGLLNATLLFVIILIVIPISQAFAYTTPYYATRLNDTASIGFQDSQVVAKGNTIYIASYSDCYVHKIVDNTHTVTVAGIQGYCGYSRDGSVAARSTLEGPTSIAVGADGTVYIAEPYQHHVRAVLPDGTLTTVAGNGTSVNASLRTDAPDATQTAFDFPTYVKMGPDNNLYVYDTGVIRRILPDGSTDHVAGAFTAFANTNPYVEGGVATEHFLFKRGAPGKALFAFDSERNLLISDISNIYKINSSDGTIHTYYTQPSNPTYTLEDQPLSETPDTGTGGFEIDNEGRIWIGQGSANTGLGIRYISPIDQIVRTVAGGGNNPVPPLTGSGDIMPMVGSDLELPSIQSISVDNGLVYYISSYTTNVGAIVHYVGRLSTNQDTTPPVITYNINPSPNDRSWNDSPVTVNFSCSDNLSGVAYCSPPMTESNDGIYTLTGTAVDNAGNMASITVTVNIDTSVPSVGTPTWSSNPVITGYNTILNVPASTLDNHSPLAGGEYYIGNIDPGQGSGIPMTYDGTTGNLTAEFGSDLPAGVYQVNVRAQNDAGAWSPVVSSQLVVAGIAPTVTSPNNYTTGVRQIITPSDFTFTTNGSPTPTLSENGILPSGISFIDNGDGTANFKGMVAAGTAGVYPITITASSSAGTFVQTFNLTITNINSAPTVIFSSTGTDTLNAIAGNYYSSTFTATGNGKNPKIFVYSGSLPPGMNLRDNKDGTASLFGTPSKAGTYIFTLEAQNKIGTTYQQFTFVVS